MLLVHRRGGKALDVSTPIPMADGSYRPIGEIRDGDMVLDERGLPARVVAAHDVMHDRPCYELVFSDGARVVCDSQHEWVTQTKADRAHRVGRERDLAGRMSSGTAKPLPGRRKTTAEIASTLHYAGETNHSVRLAGAAKYPEADLLIPPYVLGAWLGDGTSDGASITTMDEEILEPIAAYAAQWGGSVKQRPHRNTGKAHTYGITGSHRGSRGESMQAHLRRLGVLKNKHIPEGYLRASVGQRQDLLKGLMDTDGSVSKGGRACEITQKNHALAVGIMRLLWGLGQKPTMGRKMVDGSPYWRVAWRPLEIPFGLRRKREQVASVPETSTARNRYIVDARRVASRPVRCLTVDSPSHQYLCGREHIPTHNTTLAAMELFDAALKFEGGDGHFAYVAPFLKQAKEVAWDMLKSLAGKLPEGLATPHEGDNTIRFANGSKISLYGADNPDALRGIHLDGAVLDELAQMKPDTWKTVVSIALMDRDGWCLFIGTAKGLNALSELYYAALKSDAVHPKSGKRLWAAKNYTWRDTKVFTDAEIDMARSLRTDAQFRQEFENDFSAASEYQLVALDEVMAARERHLKPDQYEFAAKILGVDVAFAESGDRSVIQPRQGLLATEPGVFRGIDNMELAAHVAAVWESWDADACFIDAGRGEGVIHRLRQIGFKPTPVDFGGKPTRGHYVNMRSQMWGAIPEWLREGAAIVAPIHGEELQADLCAPTYKHNPVNDRVMLETKDEMKKRDMPSPDLADALALTFAHPVRGKMSPEDPMWRLTRKSNQTRRAGHPFEKPARQGGSVFDI